MFAGGYLSSVRVGGQYLHPGQRLVSRIGDRPLMGTAAGECSNVPLGEEPQHGQPEEMRIVLTAAATDPTTTWQVLVGTLGASIVGGLLSSCRSTCRARRLTSRPRRWVVVVVLVRSSARGVRDPLVDRSVIDRVFRPPGVARRSSGLGAGRRIWLPQVSGVCHHPDGHF